MTLKGSHIQTLKAIVKDYDEMIQDGEKLSDSQYQEYQDCKALIQIREARKK